MKGKILYSHATKFNGADGSEVVGFQTGVVYNDEFGIDRCREIWTRHIYEKGSEANVVYSRKKNKYYLFDIES